MDRPGWCCVFALVMTPLSLSGQAKSGTRAADGHPDLQGMWTNVTITPLERPRDLAGKAYFTPEEAAAYEKRIIEGREQADPDAAGTVADPVVWWERGMHVVSTLRTSMIIDPADGRLPPLTVEAQKRMQDSRAYSRLHPADGPEDRSIQERCLMEGSTGPPMLSGPYNNNIQIVQAAGSVMMVTEMIHDVRVIPMDGRPHLPQNIRLWTGDPRGHWEGDSLVVDSTNFTNKTHFRGSDENLHLIERFRLADPETIIYQFTIDDPTAFSKPWTGELPMHRTTEPMYEFACHEGNRAMEHILINARAAEKKAGN
ncbi:MAG TPA: hypothetical protein VMH05_10660 [Bryobacteraceae bacterium]|nr:hypothetical protein [Bryobacteraceae bacterium]